MDESFRVNNQKLVGRFVFPAVLKDKNPAILFIHGLTGHKESSFQYAEGLAKIGYISFLFDMRGHGESEGDLDILTAEDFMEDVVSGYDVLANTRGVDKNNISVAGTSMGSYLAVRLCSKRQVENLVMRAPADYPNEIVNEPIMEHGGENPNTKVWREKVKQYNESSALQAIHDFDGRVLFIESEKDDMVPHTTVMNYMNAVKDKSKSTHVLIKDAPHSIKEGKFRDEVERIMIKWFGEIKNS